ncbi:MAG: hypothetical protein RLZZ306_2295 [Bacteroidota bacterium]
MRKYILIIWVILSSCISTKMIPVQNNETLIVKTFSPIEPSSVTIFLLERDIPLSIERLGVLKIDMTNAMVRFDAIEEKLRIECAKIGANGAFRLNEGTIITNQGGVISYLCFRY